MNDHSIHRPFDAFDLTKHIYRGMFETPKDDIEYQDHLFSKMNVNSEEEFQKNVSTLISEVLQKSSNLPDEKKLEILTLYKQFKASPQTLTTTKAGQIFLDRASPDKPFEVHPDKGSMGQQMGATSLKVQNVIHHNFPDLNNNPDRANHSAKPGEETISKLDERKLRKLEKQRLKDEKIAGAKKKNEKSSFEVTKNEHVPTTLKLDSHEKIKNMRYSQDSIADKSADGIDLFTVIKDKGWKTGVTMMGVEMPDGKYTSLDNRRLFALKRIVNEAASNVFKEAAIKPAMHIYKHDHTSEKIQKEVKRLKNLSENLGRSQGPGLEESGIKEGTIGALVYYRMRGGGANSLNEKNTYGFESNPLVRPS